MSMRELLSWLLQGHKDATDLCVLVFEWANDYDHLADRDVPVEQSEALLHRCMWAVAVQIPNNLFFKQHRAQLQVSLESGISTWRIANSLQGSEGSKGHELAHVLRWTPIEFFLRCARIIAGEEWVQEVAPLFWLKMTQDHSFGKFASECGSPKPGSGRNYDMETTEYLGHGIRVIQAGMFGSTEAAHAYELYRMISPPKGARVIDMGCGVGEIGRLFLEIDPTVKYLGVTNSATQQAHVTAAGLSCRLGDFASVPVKDGVADVVMFNESIGYGDLTTLLKEAFRLLQPGGVLFIKDWDAPLRSLSVDWGYQLTPATAVLQELSGLGFENTVMQSPMANYDRYNKFMAENQYMNTTHSNGALKATSVIRAVKRKGA